jgi:alpha-tubulin suppressor-like RCC1 family protein
MPNASPKPLRPVGLVRAAIVALLTVLSVVMAASTTAEAKSAPKPKLQHVVATPSTITKRAGTTTITATLTGATSCSITSIPAALSGTGSVACAAGSVSRVLAFPLNTATKKIVKYKVTLTATGAGGTKAKKAVVRVGPSAGGSLGGGKGPGRRAVASDGYGYCAILSTGHVDCWGDNANGELGNGTIGGPGNENGGYDTPQPVARISDAASVVGGTGGYCAVLSTGGVDCWGSNLNGELGNGTTSGPDHFGYDTPQPVTGITDAASVVKQGDGYCAVLSTGKIDCWGYNNWGELGNGTVGGPDGADGYDTPQPVAGITDATSLASAVVSACAVLSTGGVDCWGDNFSGELGNGTIGGSGAEGGYDTPQRVTGITDATSIASALGITQDAFGVGFCAVLSTGKIDCWGSPSQGELGNGTIEEPDGDYGYDTPQAVARITDATSITGSGWAGQGYCAVLSTGGVDCWGSNSVGELGNGTVGGPDGAEGYDTPQPVTHVTDAVSVVSQGYGYCAALSTGGVDCWGSNTFGQLGNGTVGGLNGADGYDIPQPVTHLTDAVSLVSDGTVSDGISYCAVLSTGGVDCWGSAINGELGNGISENADYDTPQAVTDITDAA